MEERTDYPPSTLVIVRVWPEDNAEGQQEWRGILRCLPDGEERPFRGWPGLIHLMEEMAERS